MRPDVVIEKDPRAAQAIERYDELREPRRPFERDWRDIARLIRPQRGGFDVSTPTQRELTKALSSEAMIAHGNFAAGIYASITNPATRWGGLTTPDEDLNRWPPFAEWLDRTANKVHRSFSPSMSSFYSASYQAYADLAAFGNAAGYDELVPSRRKFRDETVSLAEVACDVDFDGRVNEIVRKTYLSPRQAGRKFKVLPNEIQKLAEKGSVEKHAYYHHILPNDLFVPQQFGLRGKRFLSRWVCEVEQSLLRQRGFGSMPFYFPRWDVDTGMTYGTGPGFIALPSARSGELMSNATLRAAQRAADPTKLAPDRKTIPLNGVFRPGGVVYGAVGMRGERLVHSEDFNGNIGLTHEEKRATYEAVRDAFYYSVMSLTGRTGISDDENRVIEEARLRNWAPHSDRIMEEYAAPKFERRYWLLLQAGQIDPLPEGTPTEGLSLQVQYTSAAAQALQASEARNVRTFVNDLGAIAQIKPEILDRLSADDVAEIMHDASPSLPQRLLVSRDVAQQMREQRAQAEQASQAMAMAQQGGVAARDFAQASAVAQGANNGADA